MGEFSVQVIVSHPSDADRVAQAELLVVTGATLTWIPRELLEHLHVPLLGRRSFLVADGRTVERDTAGARIRLDSSEAIVTVVLAEPGDGNMLAATTLESLGFAVDPIGKRLIPQQLLAL